MAGGILAGSNRDDGDAGDMRGRGNNFHLRGKWIAGRVRHAESRGHRGLALGQASIEES